MKKTRTAAGFVLLAVLLILSGILNLISDSAGCP